MLGIQFATLFTDDLYMRVSSHAIQMAARITGIFRKHGISMAYDSPTNQQFVVLSPERYRALKEKVAFEVWEHQDGGNIVCRFVTKLGYDR